MKSFRIKLYKNKWTDSIKALWSVYFFFAIHGLNDFSFNFFIFRNKIYKRIYKKNNHDLKYEVPWIEYEINWGGTPPQS